MRRSPFYPSMSSSRFNSPLQQQHPSNFHTQAVDDPFAYFHPRPVYPHSSNSPSAPARSVIINIPVQDSTSTTGTPPSHSKTSHLHANHAAIRIQSCFRGFAVRRHRPILNLRTISNIDTQLQQLKVELESPGFSAKIRANDRERLRFSETVMAFILRLDAIEGLLPEIRSQRKEVTKTAIKLQDAVDAIMLQSDDALAASANEGPLGDGTKGKDEALAHVGGVCLGEVQQETQESQHRVNKEPHLSGNDGDILLDGDSVAVALPSADQDDVLDAAWTSMDTQGESLLTVDSELTSLNEEAGEDSNAAPEDKLIEPRNQTEQDILMETRDLFGNDEGDRQVSRVESGNELIETRNELDHKESPADASVQNVPLTAGTMDRVPDGIELVSKQIEWNAGCVGGSADNQLSPDLTSSQSTENVCLSKDIHINLVKAVQSSPEIGESLEKSSTKTIREPLNEEVKMLSVPSSNSPFVADKKQSSQGNDSPHPHHFPTTEGELTEGVTTKDSSSPQEVTNWMKPQCCETEDVESSIVDKVLLQQLSSDCKQLKSLFGKLLVQTRAQSKVICALSDRLEALEQQQLNNKQHAQRKRNKGSNKSKRNSKVCHSE